MKHFDYGYRTMIDVSFDDAVARVTEALRAERFGVLTEIDVKATLRKKLDRSGRHSGHGSWG